MAVDANLDSQKKSGETQLRKIRLRIDALRSQQRGIAEKCAARVIPDEVAKELLSQNELEMAQLDVQKRSVGASVLTTGDVIEKGLAVLNDWGLLTEVQPDHQAAVPKVLIPGRNDN